ncbi:TPM domain-containing protein [Flavobacterium sp. NRK F10]|uniref:TPM domain-containing protein n=1 Tax=Flavobacterium sp. NRK F10 TaxID=2954931 RepID=UPI0020913A83|nr:TPM domain-containing protein [Flavobacterium sp. NRK F10]MCO6176403.1 TPM domain-containing protein [Flavobacterium sp. NRK F10]
MKKKITILIVFIGLNFLPSISYAQGTETKKDTIGFVFSQIDKFKTSKYKGQIINDYDTIFTSTEIKELSDILYTYYIETTRQIVVVTVKDIEPYSDIQKYATDLGNYWGVGMAEKGNGLIIILCKPCKKIGIASGTETQLILTNEICEEVITNKIIPEFMNGHFYEGIKKGIMELIEKWE